MAIPLERLFGSRTRAKLLHLFTNGIRRPYYVRELTRLTKERVNSIRREVENLRRIGLLTTHSRNGRKYYAVNPNFPLLEELAQLTAKMGKPVPDRMFEGIRRVGSVRLAILTGLFAQYPSAPTDLLVVGMVREHALRACVSTIEEELGKEVRYTVMSLTEYRYRKSMNDQFLQDIEQAPHVELINQLEKQEYVK